MDTGIYVALSKELGILRDVNVTANNLANMTTTGYEGDSLLFRDYLVNTPLRENNIAYTNDIGTYRDNSQGPLQATGNPLDAAIVGTGYFAVQTPLGTRYTRSGNFKVNATGTLVTLEGYPVLDQTNQPISFDETDRDINIREDGTISVDGTNRATLNIVQFDNDHLLEKVGNTMFKTTAPAKPAQNFTVAGGMLESSNVKPVLALTHMIATSRSLGDTANYISTINTLARKASDTLAKVY